MIVIPDSFQQRILTVHGNKGQQWLENLPHLLRSLEKKWGIKVGDPVQNLSYGYVCSALRADGAETILKVTYPDNAEDRDSIAALAALRGRHVVSVLEYDAKRCATLLSKIAPGTPLHEVGDNRKESIIAAQLMRDIPVPVPKGSSFKTLRNWIAVFDRLDRSSLPFPALMLDRAQMLFEELDASIAVGVHGQPSPKLRPVNHEPLLLHGDLHHENILLDHKRGWTAIDPKGVIADPIFECARFLHNIWPSQKQDDLNTLLQERTDVFSQELHTDPKRIMGWGFVDCILSACWSIEDGEENWQEAIRCAELLGKMLS